MLMHKILQNRLLCAFVANLKIDSIYALYLESFCDKNLAIRKVFAFCDSDEVALQKRYVIQKINKKKFKHSDFQKNYLETNAA